MPRRTRSRNNSDTNLRARRALGRYSRSLRFEPLEDRRLLHGGLGHDVDEGSLSIPPSSPVAAEATLAGSSAIGSGAGGISTSASSFAQASWLNGDEATVLTVDTAGGYHVAYSPNFDLGYIDPETGDLLICDYYPGTTSVFVLNCAVSGNVSNLVGLHYSNGQLIASDGGNTVYHRDGSTMRSGGSWFYDAGSVLKVGASYNWSNGTALKTGSTFFHPNGATFRNAANSIFYATASTFYNAATTALFYPSGQALRNVATDYFYETGAPLETNDVTYYGSGAVMVDAVGTPHNTNGSVAILPFSRYAALANSESFTNVTADFSETTTSIAHDIGGGFGAYVTYQKIVYQAKPPEPTNIAVAMVDDGTLLFTWASGGGSTVDYLVATTMGGSPPGDYSTGTATTNNFLAVGGLAAGAQVSIRLCARDGAGTLSDPVTATGTAGVLTQAPQTGYLIESGLVGTFAQVLDNANKGIIFTVDRDNHFQVFFRPNAELGYLNPENGDRLECSTYEIPWTETRVANIDDCRVMGNLASIPSGAQYANGQVIRSGDTFYYDTGAVLRSAGLTWFHSNGNTLKSGSTYYWINGVIMRSLSTNAYPTGGNLKSISAVFYDHGNTFLNATSAFYPSGSNLKTSGGDLFYQNGAQLFASNVFRYPNNATMISANGTPFNFNGTQAPLPYDHSETMATGIFYSRLGVDEIFRYGFAMQGDLAVFMYGGSHDYSVPVPPNPLGLAVQSAGPNSVTFTLTTGVGSTQDYLVAYNVGAIAPLTCQGGVVVAGPSFTINGLAPNQQIAVRVCARNSEGETSPGITATGQTTLPLLPGDYNGNQAVDAADYVLWRKSLNTPVTPYTAADGSGNGTIDAADYDVWRAHFGQTFGVGVGQAVPDEFTNALHQAQPDLQASDNSIPLTRQAQPDLQTSAEPIATKTPPLISFPLPLSTFRLASIPRPSLLTSRPSADALLLAWLESHADHRHHDVYSPAPAIADRDEVQDAADPSFDPLDEVFATLDARW